MARTRIPLVALFIALAAGATLAEPEVERDDPTARLRESEKLHGQQSPAQRWRVLQEARKERDHYAGSGVQVQPFSTSSGNLLLSPDQQLQASAVQGSVFVSLGPASADYEFNGARYFETDSGRARQVLTHPTDPDILYLATSGGGVWKSWDAGAHWEPITDQLGTTSIGTLAMDPLNPDILYLGFGDPFDVHQPGLVRSTDGGATWSEPVQLVSGAGKVASSVTDIEVDPLDSAVVYATTDVGFFRSTDAGASWREVPLTGAAPGDTFFYMWSVAWAGGNTWLATGQLADPTKPVSLLSNVSQLGLWRSTDGGLSWQWNANALPGGDSTAATAGRGTLVAAPSTLVDAATSRIFLLAGTTKGDAQLDLFRSEDGGQTFVALGMNAHGAPGNPNSNQLDLDILHQQAWYNQAIAVDPANPDLVFVGGDLSMVRSTDGGNSWSVITNWLPGPQSIGQAYVHADLHSLAVGADGVLYAGSDGGIAYSPDARTATNPSAVTFSSTRNKGIVTHLIYTVACAPESWPADMQGWVGGGMQDNGTRIRSGSSTVFNQVVGGDGIGIAVSGGTHLDAALQANVPDAVVASSEFMLFRSGDGGQSWLPFNNGMQGQLPFFVRVARDVAAADGQTFVTFTGAPPAVYVTSGGGAWADISGTLHWQDSGADTRGFVTRDGKPIALRNLATHPLRSGVYAMNSNKFAYVTADNGAHWLVSMQPAPPGAPAGTGAYLLSSVAFDRADTTGNTYYLTSKAMDLADADGNTVPMPESFGHLYKTTDGGLHWTSLGTQALGAGGLPFVPFDVVTVDPGDNNTLYVGTALGLYRSVDGGLNWERMGAGSLPLVSVTDLCISPGSSRLTVATYGRGFWQIGTGAGSNPAGVKGTGDTNFDQRIDGLDLIDVADVFGTTQASPLYRWQADLTGSTNAVDDADLAALLAKFGGTP